MSFPCDALLNITGKYSSSQKNQTLTKEVKLVLQVKGSTDLYIPTTLKPDGDKRESGGDYQHQQPASLPFHNTSQSGLLPAPVSSGTRPV